MKTFAAFVLLVSTALLLCGFQQQGILTPIVSKSAAVAGGSIARVGTPATANGGTSPNPYSVSLNQATGTGHLLVVTVFKFFSAGGSTTPTIQDCASAPPCGASLNTWSTAINLTSNAGTGGCCGSITVFYTCNSVSGANFTTATITDKTSSMVEQEYSGAPTSLCLDAVSSAINVQNGVTSWSSTAVSTTATDLLIGAVVGFQSNNRTFAASAPYSTLIDAPNTADGDDAFTEDQLNVASGSKSSAGTCVSSNVMNAFVSFKSQ